METIEKTKLIFEERLLESARISKEELGYMPSYFLRMMRENGGILTAKILINEKKIPDGFTQMYLRNRLDLTIEAIVIEPQFRALFTPEELQKAEKRLKECGYQVDTILDS
jgi:hypothetical protein